MNEQTTEDAILATVPELGDDTPYGDDTEGSLGPTEAEREAATDRSSTSESSPQQEDTPSSTQQETWYNQDAKGNLIDSRGNIAIAAGQARRLFDSARREAREYEQQVREAQQRIAEFERLQQETRVSHEALNGVPAQLGMSAEDVQNAFKFWNGLRVSPAETVKDLINHARKLGHQVDGAGQGLDPEMLKATMSEVLRPVLDAQKQNDELEHRRQAVRKEIDSFMSDYADAKIHEPMLAALIREQPGMTLHKAYSTLREYAYRNQLDWSQPLNQQRKQTNGNGANTTNDPSLVSGHNIGPAGASALTDSDNADEFYSPDKDWRSIVTEQMTKAGM